MTKKGIAMKKFGGKIFVVIGLMISALVGLAMEAKATPSTYIWIPSVDIQPFGVLHLGIDNYYRFNGFTPTDFGLTIGVLPFEKVQAEVGVDWLLDTEDPTFFNFKLGVPEGAFHKWQPALAIGGFNFGTQYHKDQVKTDFNIGYGLVAKTLPFLGRFTAGYYGGNQALLRDPAGRRANHGFLFAWDRTLSEISDRLWVGVDYQGGMNDLGAVNFGVAWKFAPNFAVIFGYDHYLNDNKHFKPRGEARFKNSHDGTYTVQFDIDFDLTSWKNFQRDVKQIGRIPLNIWEDILNFRDNAAALPETSMKFWEGEWKKTKELFSF